MCDAHYPGDERCAANLVTLDRCPRLQKRLRRQVLGLRRVAYHIVDVAVDAGDVHIVESAEGFLIALDRAINQRTLLLSLLIDDF